MCIPLTVSVLVSAVHPSLLALAVVAGAVGALDDARCAVGAVFVSVSVACLGAGGTLSQEEDEEEGGGGGGQGEGGLGRRHVADVGEEEHLISSLCWLLLGLELEVD